MVTRKVFSVDALRNMNIMISVPLLVLIITGTYKVGGVAHESYIGWHDERYVKINDALTLAAKKDIDKQVKAARDISLSNQQVLSNNTHVLEETRQEVATLTHSFEVYAAVATVNYINQALDRKEAEQPQGAGWREERDRLRRQLKSAELFRDCVLRGKVGCEALRPNGQ